MELIRKLMRRGLLELCLIIIAVIGIHAERLLHNGSVEGRVLPVPGANPAVIAVKGKDSVKIVTNNGHFGMDLQPGDWRLIFVKDQQSFTTEKKVLIQEGQRINLGDIRISQ